MGNITQRGNHGRATSETTLASTIFAATDWTNARLRRQHGTTTEERYSRDSHFRNISGLVLFHDEIQTIRDVLLLCPRHGQHKSTTLPLQRIRN